MDPSRSPDLSSCTSFTLTDHGEGKSEAMSMKETASWIEDRTDAASFTEKKDMNDLEAQLVTESGGYPCEKMNKIQIALLMTGLALASFTSSLNSTVVSPALGTIAADLNDLADELWVATAYMITFNASQPLYGKFSDIFGRKPVILVGLSLFLIGALISSLAETMVMLIVARAVQGLGGGGVLSMVLIIIADLFPVEKRLQYQSVVTAMFGVASVVGPLMGGAFVDSQKLTWRWDFWIGVLLGGASFLAIFSLLRLPSKDRGTLMEQIKRVDYLGTIAELGCVVALMLALNWGGSKFAWGSGTIIGLFVVFIAFLAIFILIEAKFTQEPVIPPRLFKNLSIVAIFICQFLLGATFLGVLYFSPVFSQIVFNADATSSGIRLIPLMASLVVLSIVTAGLLPIIKKVNVFIILGCAIVTGSFGAFYTMGADATTAQQIGYMILCGAGLGCSFQMNILAAQAAVEKKDIAIATSLAQFANTLGGAIGIALFGAILQNDLLNSFAFMDKTIISQAIANGYTPGQSALSQISLLPDEIRQPIIQAYVHGIQHVYLAGICIAGLAFISSLFIHTKNTSEVEANQAKEENM